MPRGGKRIELKPKTCALPTCDQTFERQLDQTTTQFRRKRHCSAECRAAGHGVRPPKDGLCGNGLHEMTEDNTYRRPGTGAKQCRACTRAREQKAPEPVAVATLPDERWRPAGFTSEPATWHAGQVAS